METDSMEYVHTWSMCRHGVCTYIFYAQKQKHFSDMAVFHSASTFVEDGQRQRNNDMDWETYPNLGINIVQYDTRTHLPVQS